MPLVFSVTASRSLLHEMVPDPVVARCCMAEADILVGSVLSRKLGTGLTPASSGRSDRSRRIPMGVDPSRSMPVRWLARVCSENRRDIRRDEAGASYWDKAGTDLSSEPLPDELVLGVAGTMVILPYHDQAAAVGVPSDVRHDQSHDSGGPDRSRPSASDNLRLEASGLERTCKPIAPPISGGATFCHYWNR